MVRPQLEHCPVLGGAGRSPGEESSENEQRCRKNMTCKDRLEETGLFSLENTGERHEEHGQIAVLRRETRYAAELVTAWPRHGATW